MQEPRTLLSSPGGSTFGGLTAPAAGFRRGRPSRRSPGPPQVLDHPARAAILDVVRRDPGIPFLAIFDELRRLPAFEVSLGNGSLVWHLSRLERAGLLSSRRSGRARRYYPSSGPWHADLAACAFVQSTARWPIATTLVETSNATLADLRQRLPATQDRSAAGLRIQLGLMRELGLLDAERHGRALHYRATPKLHQAVKALSAKTLAAHRAQPGLAVEAEPWPVRAELGASPVVTAAWA